MDAPDAQGQPPFMPMFIGMNAPPQQISSSLAGPPARVRAAMALLSDFCDKTRSRIAANDISIEEFPGQKLSMSELRTQEVACDMLCSYFRGRLEPDWFELGHTVQQGVLQSTEGVYGKEKPVDGIVTVCMFCLKDDPEGVPGANCKWCLGTGKLLVSPCPEEFAGGGE